MAGSGEVLTRAEARRRAQLVRNVAYTVDLDFTGEPGRSFASRTTVRFAAIPGETTFVDLTAVEVDSAMLNGRRLPPTRGGRIPLPDLLASNQLVVQARCAYSRASAGMHRFVDPEDGEAYLYTQFQPFDAHRVFACFDQPDIKATLALSVRAPSEWVVVGNSIGRRDGDRWRFEPTPPIPTYVMAVVAGPYHHVHDRHGDIDLGAYCRRSLTLNLEPEEVFDLTRRGLDFYTELFGCHYPFAKYDQLFVPEFPLGAMENAGCVTIDDRNVFRSAATEADRLVRANLILHEMAHMWFGNLVTMRWWDDLWLNEAFATYLASLTLAEATQFSEQAWVEFAYLYKPWAYEQDQRPTTHPIIADIPHTAGLLTHFDGITYGKGAAVVKQLAHWVGRTAFRDGVRAHIAEHAFGTGDLTDFLCHLERAFGRELSTWSQQWLATAGLGVLRAECDIDDDGRLTACTVFQQAPPDHPTLRQHRIAIGLYTADEDGLTRTMRVELDVHGPCTTVPGLAGERADLVLLNDDDLSYVKVRFDERSLMTLHAGLGGIIDPLARALCWSGLWEMTRDGELPARDWVALVASHAEQENNPTVLQALLGQAVHAIDDYSAPGSGAALRRVLAAAARQALGRAKPGSDAQLIWARRTIAVDPDPTFARDLLSGRTSVPDLTLDADLRWQLIVRLAVLGDVDEQEIAAESARDPSDLGYRRAWTARASLPDSACKAAAFVAACDGQDREGITLSLATQRAILAGFWRAEQAHLLEPYVAHRWIDALAQVWAKRDADEGLALTSALFPATRPDPALVAAADRLLDVPWLPRAGQRIVIEGRDDAQRALRAQRVDAAVGGKRESAGRTWTTG